MSSPRLPTSGPSALHDAGEGRQHPSRDGLVWSPLQAELQRVSEDNGTRDVPPYPASQDASQRSAAVPCRMDPSTNGQKASQRMAAPVATPTSDDSVDAIGDVQRPQDSVTSAMSARLQKRSSVPGWDSPDASRGHDDTAWPPGAGDQSRASLVCPPAHAVPCILTQFPAWFMSQSARPGSIYNCTRQLSYLPLSRMASLQFCT